MKLLRKMATKLLIFQLYSIVTDNIFATLKAEALAAITSVVWLRA